MAEEVEGNFGAEKICRSCVFYVSQFREDGYCHAHPPIFDRGSSMSKFPNVKLGEWCGEWKAKVTNAGTE